MSAHAADRYVVARASDLPDGARVIVEVAGRSIGVFNVGGTFHALLNRCPHKGAELCKGDILEFVLADRPGSVRLDSGRKFIVCPWHGWEYDLLTGETITGARDGRAHPLPVDLEGGGAVEAELSAAAVARPERPGAVFTKPRGQKALGEYRAEVIPLAVEEDYVVVTLRGSR